MNRSCRSSSAPVLWVVVATLLVSLGITNPVVAQQKKKKKPSNFLDYMFKVFSADTMVTQPLLSPTDLESIDKIEMMLNAHNQQYRHGSNYLMLGLLAGARGDVDAAERHLRTASRYATCSPLPLTMAGQIQMQAGKLEAALATHSRVTWLDNRSTVLSANTFMDQAVVSAQRGDDETALQRVRQALRVIKHSHQSPREKAFSYQQLGVVLSDSIGNHAAAQAAWNRAAKALSDDRPTGWQSQLHCRVADGYAADRHAEAAAHLAQAARGIDQLKPAQQAQARLRIGSRFVQLANKHENADYARQAEELLVPLIETEDVPPGTLDVHRDAALALAQLWKQSRPARARRLVRKAIEQTLEIGQQNSMFGTVLAGTNPRQELNRLQLDLDESSEQPAD